MIHGIHFDKIILVNEVVELFGAHDNRTCDLPQVKRFLLASDVP